MGPWLRVLVAFGAVAVAAVLLKVVPPVLVLLLFVGGVAYVNRELRRRAREAPKTGAELLGLKRERSDPFGILGYPLALFGRITDAAIDELVWGSWSGLDVRVFAVSFAAPTLPGQPGRRTSLACALTHVVASLPAVVVEPPAFLLTMLERPPLAPAVETGDAAFDAALNVWAEDPGPVHDLLEPPMREWLRSIEPSWGVDVSGRVVMVYGPRPDRPDVVTILETLRDFLARLPADLRASPPPPFEDGRTAS